MASLQDDLEKNARSLLHCMFVSVSHRVTRFSPKFSQITVFPRIEAGP